MDDLVTALRSGEQADMDGTLVKVSRQACEEAADAIEALQAQLAEARDDAMNAPDYFRALPATANPTKGTLGVGDPSRHQPYREPDMSTLKALREKVESMKVVEIDAAKTHPIGSELRLMKACRADGMIAVLTVIDAAIRAMKGEMG